MPTLLDSGGKVKGGDGSQDNHATGNTASPTEGNAKDKEGPKFERKEIFDIHRSFLDTFGSQCSGKSERGVTDKVVEDCLKRSYENKGWGSREADIILDILGEASEGNYGFQTILHMIPPTLGHSNASAGEDPGRSTVTENFTGLFRWLMERFPDLYSLKGGGPGSHHSNTDFLQVAIDYATVQANLDENPDAVNTQRILAAAPREILKVFVCEFPKQVAELLRVGPAPIDGNHAHRVHDLLSLVEGFEKIEPLFEALDVATTLATDGRGNTVLHRAVKYGTSRGLSVEGTQVLRIVQSLVEKCPGALKVLNSDKLSPYRTRVRNLVEAGDKVLLFLKDQYIRYPLNVAADLLYGGMGGPELYLNLEYLENKAVPEKELASMLARLNFDTHLKFVRLPRFKIIPEENRRSNGSRTQREQPWGGRGDFGIVFRKLKEFGVTKIVKIEVEDLDRPHRDDIIIDSLKDFNIEEWDWRKLDLCTEVIGQAAKQVRRIELYSSGNNAVLRAWSGKDGLRSFGKLENVHVTFKQGLGKETSKKIPATPKFPKWDISIASSQSSTSAGGGGDGGISVNPWIRDMAWFSDFVVDEFWRAPSGEAVKVAIIDDGINLLSAEPGREQGDLHGCSFDPDREKNPWYAPHGKHGTLMAKLVRLMCPGSILYIARLGPTIPHPAAGSWQLQPTTASAIEAINWAVGQDVDIILMSCAIVALGGEERQEYAQAINAARSKGALLFSAAYKENTSPADSYEGIIYIGGADINGNRIAGSYNARTKFTFPSSGLGYLCPQDRGAAGSSISAALAAGLAALILYCAEYTGLGKSRPALKGGMVQVLDTMVENVRPQYVNPKLFFDPNQLKHRHEKGATLIRTAIAGLTKAAKL